MPSRRRASRAGVATVAGISAVVLVGAGGAVSYATTRGSATAYVTAIAGAHSVLQSLQTTGTTEPSSVATVSFAVSGTVATVPVTMGQQVTAGQVLATLDSTALKLALATAQGQVANANLTLAQAENGQVSGVSGSGNSSSAGAGDTKNGSTGNGSTKISSTGSSSTKISSTGNSSTKISSTGSHSDTGSTASITAAQKVLLATVHQVDSLLAETKTGLRLTTAQCTIRPTTPTPKPTPTTPTPKPTPTTSTTPTPTPTPTPTTSTPTPTPTTWTPTPTPTPTRTTSTPTPTPTTSTPTPTPTTSTPTPTPTTSTPTPTPTTSTPTPTPTTSTPTPTPTTSTPTPTPTTSTPTPPSGALGAKTTAAPAALVSAQNVAFTTRSSRPATCVQRQHLVLGDEMQLFALQQHVSTQEGALDKLITSATASTGKASTGKAPTGTVASGGTALTGASATGTSSEGKSAATGTASKATATTATTATTAKTSASSSKTVAVSAAQLAADQAAVDAANANLVLAQQQLSQATIVSPLSGEVSSVGLTVGQQATAGSSTEAVDVIDPNGHSVTLSVDVTKIPQVAVGEQATVVPDGSFVPLAATVSYVAAAPTSSSSTSYNVRLAFASDPSTLRDGIQAAVTITTAQAVNALSVPTSAVHHLGVFSYVLLLNAGTTKAQRITVGSVGAIYTQVASGLTAGQRVVLANPATPIPTSTITGRVARITGGATSGTAGLLGGGTGGAGAVGVRAAG
jgi:RND family efflux transporter MFP subunit